MRLMQTYETHTRRIFRSCFAFAILEIGALIPDTRCIIRTFAAQCVLYIQQGL